MTKLGATKPETAARRTVRYGSRAEVWVARAIIGQEPSCAMSERRELWSRQEGGSEQPPRVQLRAQPNVSLGREVKRGNAGVASVPRFGPFFSPLSPSHWSLTDLEQAYVLKSRPGQYQYRTTAPCRSALFFLSDLPSHDCTAGRSLACARPSIPPKSSASHQPPHSRCGRWPRCAAGKVGDRRPLERERTATCVKPRAKGRGDHATRTRPDWPSDGKVQGRPPAGPRAVSSVGRSLPSSCLTP